MLNAMGHMAAIKQRNRLIAGQKEKAAAKDFLAVLSHN
jgi:hypothetical protein